MKRIKSLYPVVFITLLIILATSSLAITNNVTAKILSLQQDEETLTLLQQIFAEASYYSYDEESEIYTVYDSDRNDVGYAFYGEQRGYQSTIIVLIGLEDTETIKNIVIISQNETSANWNRVTSSDFLEQFIGLAIENCYAYSMTYHPDGIDTVSGATVSSTAIVTAVRNAILEKLEYLN